MSVQLMPCNAMPHTPVSLPAFVPFSQHIRSPHSGQLPQSCRIHRTYFRSGRGSTSPCNTTYNNDWMTHLQENGLISKVQQNGPCDFFLKGRGKDKKGGMRNAKTSDERNKNQRDLFRNFPHGFLRRAVDNVKVRLDKCFGKEGGYVKIGTSH